MNKLRIRTKCQEARAARDLKIYNEYHAFRAANPEQSITELHEYLLNKYNLHGRGMIYTILKRVEKRLKMQAA